MEWNLRSCSRHGHVTYAPDEPEYRAKPRRGMRYYTIGSAIVLALAICYVGWTFFSRWQYDRALAEKTAAAKRAQAQQTFQDMGGNRFDILDFYAQPKVSAAATPPRSVTAYPTLRASNLIRRRA